jgi:hypothetical protein
MPNPGPEASRKQVAAFHQYLSGKNDVRSTEEIRPGVVRVERVKRPALTVKLVDIYCVSESDVISIRSSDPDVNVVVTASGWNTYTPQAKQLAVSSDVGLFSFREFMAAVHLEGDVFLAHPDSEDRGSSRGA